MSESLNSSRWVRVAVWLLLTLAAARGLALVLHDPLIGLANNFDMIRVQACIDAYPVRDESIAPWTNSWQAPIERYRFLEDVDQPCFVSSEALVAFAAWPMMRWQAAASEDGSFSLRIVGLAKLALMLIIAVIAVSVLLRSRQASGALAVALLAAVVAMDPAVTQYLNGFYAEFSAFAWAFLAAVLLAAGLGGRSPGWWLPMLIFLAMVLAILAKIQYVALGLIFALALVGWMLWTGRRPDGRVTVAVVLAALVGGAAQLAHMNSESTTSIRHANLTNTVMHTVLGSATDPHRAAMRLGLPEHCGDYAGESWFSPLMADGHPCPEIKQMSRVRLLWLGVLEPVTLGRALGRGLIQVRPWLGPPVLGRQAGAESAPLPPSFFTLSDWLDRLPVGVFAVLFLAPPLIMLLLIPTARAGQLGDSLVFGLLLTAGLPWAMLVTVVFGDGLADVAKQSHLGTAALLSFWLLLAMRLISARTIHDPAYCDDSRPRICDVSLGRESSP